MAWTWLQGAVGSSTGSNTATATFSTANVQAGTKLIAYVVVSAASLPTISSVQDAALNSMTLAGQVTDGFCRVAAYFMDTPAGDVGSKPAIKVVISATGPVDILVEEVSGLLAGNTTACLDGAITGSHGTNTGTLASPTLTTTAASEYLAGLYGDDGGPYVWTDPAGGWTAHGSGINSSATADIEADHKNSTGGAESCVFTTTGTSGNASWGAIMVAFKLAAGGISGPAAQAARPGRTWQRRFWRRQALPGAASAPSSAGAVTLAAAGSLAAPAVQQSAVTLAGAGSLTGTVFADTYTDAYADAYGSATGPSGIVTGPPLATQALPGRTWRRRFWRRQIVPAVPPSGPAVIDSTGSALAGTGSLTSAAVQLAPAALAAAGSLTAASLTQAPAALAGAGSLTAAATELAPATLAAAGSLTATAIESAPAVLAGTGSLAAAAVQLAPAALAGTGSLTATGTVTGSQAGVATLAAAGSLTGTATGRAPAALAGTASLAETEVQLAPATLAAAGSLTAAALLPGTATLSAAGSLAAPGRQLAPAVLAGTGSLTALALQRAAATLAGTGSLTAVPSVTAAFTIGTLTAAAAGASTLTAASNGSTLTAATTATGTLTAATTRTGGPS